MFVSNRRPHSKLLSVSSERRQFTAACAEKHNLNTVASQGFPVAHVVHESLLSQSHAMAGSGNASRDQRTLFQFFFRSAHQREERNDDISPMKQTEHAEMSLRQRAPSVDRVATRPFRVESHRYNPIWRRAARLPTLSIVRLAAFRVCSVCRIWLPSVSVLGVFVK